MKLNDYLALNLVLSPYDVEQVRGGIEKVFPQFNRRTTIEEARSNHVHVKGEPIEEHYTDYPSVGLKAYWWRVVGTIFKREEWRKRGVHTEHSGTRYDVRTLPYGGVRLGLRMDMDTTTEKVFYIAYDARKDILYIRRDIYEEKIYGTPS
jgi:hypothetical protein